MREELTFEEWQALAAKDPEAFEQARRRAIDAFIGGVKPPYRDRLQGLQWRIDMERRRSRNPLAACVRISRMMMNRVYGRGGLLDALATIDQVRTSPLPVATVIELKPARTVCDD